ncbi:MAG TPA: DUF1330 domain-containing protein [Polyangiaceae bacterium]|nr:DUF1330 domain-containing protein [Polyangiaceae bacterium]
MAAHVVITKTRTRNQDELALYAKQAPEFMAGHAANYLARFGACEVREGAAAEGVAIIEFPTMEAARAWYDSPAYQRRALTVIRAATTTSCSSKAFPAPRTDAH